MKIHVIHSQGLSRWLDLVKPEGRRRLFSAAANAVRILVRGHLSGSAPKRHISAQMLGARPTGHIEKGTRATTFTASPESATVIIPIAGLSRAFGPVEITPRNAAALTLPISAHAYGKRVGEMKAQGWRIFRPKGRDVLMGALGDDEPTPLYTLKKRVQLKQDRSLLPGDAEIAMAANRAMMAYISRIGRRSA